MNLYRHMDRPALDAAYNNSGAVVGSGKILANWQARSDRLAAQRSKYLDLRYGEAERNRIDLFVGKVGAPVLVFIHGGYWQMRQKETFRFLANGPLARDVNVALVGYTLAPQKPLDGIVAEVRSAVGWLGLHVGEYGGDPERLYVSGWSAGGHLTAMCLSAPGVKGALAISGIFDLEPIRLCYLNDKLQLDQAAARRNSPVFRLEKTPGPLVVAYGGGELPELRRQSEEFAAARASAGLSGRIRCLAGQNHFTILEELASPDGALTAEVCELIAT